MYNINESVTIDNCLYKCYEIGSMENPAKNGFFGCPAGGSVRIMNRVVKGNQGLKE